MGNMQVQSASPPWGTTSPPFEETQRRTRAIRNLVAHPFRGWKLGECIGDGAFGKVYQCYFPTDNYDNRHMCAVKIVKIRPPSPKAVEELKNEIDIFKKIRHDRVVACYGSAEKDNCLHLFMEFMTGGSLYDRIKEKGVLSERESRKYTKQMLEGVSFLHSKNIVHRDIKGKNILLDEDENVKLADLGQSKIIQMGGKSNLGSYCGTFHWMAPEIVRGEKYGRKVDIWSVGCTVVEMLTGRPPLGDLEPAAALFRIGSRPTEPNLPEHTSKAMKDLITAALTWNPEERPWSKELLDKFFPRRCSDSFWANPFGEWQLGEYVGAGAFGEVYECNFPRKNYEGMCAVKIVKIEPQYTQSQQEVKLLTNDLNILKEIRDDRVVACYGSAEKDNCLHLFMELMTGGSLSDRIKEKGVLSERESRKYTKQMLEGVSFLHSKKIIHGNIKGSNVLLDEDENVKLADFGLSKIIQKFGSRTNLRSHCGTPYWMAPEILKGEEYGSKVDIWSVGCTVVEMLTGRPPHGDLKPEAAIFRIKSEPTIPKLPEVTSKAMKDLITAAFTWDPKKRPWSKELLDKFFPWHCSDPFWANPFGGWKLVEYVGDGAFGEVYKCDFPWKNYGPECAVKIARKEPQSQKEVEVLKNEIDILKEIRHDRVVAYYGSAETENCLHLFMELMRGGSLSDCIKEKGVLSERESRKYTKQMLEGVSFLHSKNIVHRDIKGSNVLLDKDENVKLENFGQATIIQNIGSDTNLLSKCGTPCWMAPEIFEGKGYGRKVDIWSVGCTVVEMLTGKPPLGDFEPAAAVFRIGSGPTEPNLPEHTSKAMKDLITAALTWNPEERPWSNDLLDKYFSKRRSESFEGLSDVPIKD